MAMAIMIEMAMDGKNEQGVLLRETMTHSNPVTIVTQRYLVDEWMLGSDIGHFSIEWCSNW